MRLVLLGLLAAMLASSEPAIRQLVQNWPDRRNSRFFHQQRGIALLARLDLRPDDLLAAIARSVPGRRDAQREERLWEALRVADPQAAADALARAFVAASPADRWGFYRNLHGCASEAMTRALLAIVVAWERQGAYDESWKAAIELIAEAPVPEALPVLEGAAMRLRDYGVGIPIRGIGRLASPAAAQTLWALWLARDGDHEYGYSLALALAECGESGANALERLAKARNRPWYVAYGLEALGTARGVSIARASLVAADENEAACRMRVEYAAGEPFRSEAFDAGMRSNSPFVRSQAVELAGRYPPSAAVAERIRRLALSDDPLAGAALQAVLAHDHMRARDGWVWCEPVDGLQLSFEASSEPYRHRPALGFRIRLRNAGTQPMLLASGQRLWRVHGDRPDLLLPAETDRHMYPVELAPGEIMETQAGGSVAAAAFSGTPPVWSLDFQVTIQDYPDLVGWTGRLRADRIAAPLPIPIDDRPEPAPWRAVLQAIALDGNAEAGSVIGWSTSTGLSFEVEGERGRMVGDQPWQALPADLQSITPEERRAIASILLAGDAFADPVLPYVGPPGKYPPSASLYLQARGRRAAWHGASLNPELAQALQDCCLRMARSRIATARSRWAAAP